MYVSVKTQEERFCDGRNSNFHGQLPIDSMVFAAALPAEVDVLASPEADPAQAQQCYA